MEDYQNVLCCVVLCTVICCLHTRVSSSYSCIHRFSFRFPICGCKSRLVFYIFVACFVFAALFIVLDFDFSVLAERLAEKSSLK